MPSRTLASKSTAGRTTAWRPARPGILQRCDGRRCPAGTCGHDQLRRAPAPSGPTATAAEAPAVVDEVLHSPGRPLDAGTRTAMGAAFGFDFGSVRVHDDARAAESARAVDAVAYTVGSHIVFGAGHGPSGSGAAAGAGRE